MSAEPEPWVRLPGETTRAYAAFRQYRDLGAQRTVDAMSNVSRITAQRWSRTHHWVERAQAWDSEMYRLEDARRLDQIKAMGDAHQAIARTMIAAGLRTLQEQPEMTPHQAARMLDIGTRLQRAALTGEHLPSPAAPLVDVEELSPLERIARELAGIA